MLSIIIPHYNSPESLDRLLSSIFDEASNIEVVVVDDNSNKYLDEYVKVKEKYNNVLFLRNDRGIKGAGTCRNIGLDNSEGDWILFADSDDFFAGGWYPIICDYLDRTFDIVYFSPTSINEESKGISKRHALYAKCVEDYIENQCDETEYNLKYKYVVPWSKLYRRKLITDNNIRFDEILYSNDVMFSTKSSFKSHEIACDNRTIYCVVDKGGTLTKKTTPESFLIRSDAQARQYDFVKKIVGKRKIQSIEENPIGYWMLRRVSQQRYGFVVGVKTLKIVLRYRLPLIKQRRINL